MGPGGSELLPVGRVFLGHKSIYASASPEQWRELRLIVLTELRAFVCLIQVTETLLIYQSSPFQSVKHLHARGMKSEDRRKEHLLSTPAGWHCAKHFTSVTSYLSS